MATMTKQFPDGGNLNVEYDGVGDGNVSFSADTNEGIDRSVDVVFATSDGSVKETRTVVQEGMREEFNASDGDFYLSDGGTFNVIKQKYA